MSKMPFAIKIELADGRIMQAWIDLPEGGEPESIAILSSAFGRRMHHYTPLVQFLTLNGIGSLRFDAVNHVGLSGGDLDRYILSDSHASMEAAILEARRRFPGVPQGLVSTSITSRAALRSFSTHSDLRFFVSISGVVNLRSTFVAVFGEDYFSWSADNLPRVVNFEGRDIRTFEFYDDNSTMGWVNFDEVLQSVANEDRPITWYIGEDDPWVALEDILRCEETGPTFQAVRLKNCGHDIGRVAPAARRLFIDLVRRCHNSVDGEERPVIEPRYQNILERALIERRIQRGQSEETINYK
jgi:acyl transferase